MANRRTFGGISSWDCRHWRAILLRKKDCGAIFFAGKAVLIARLGTKAEIHGLSIGSSSAVLNPATKIRNTDSSAQHTSSTETVRALIALMGFSTCEPKASMVQESFVLRDLLAYLIRDAGLEDVSCALLATASDEQSDSTTLSQKWRTWIEQESNRRSRLIAFTFLHTHSIAYNVYPTLRSNEVGLQLPCSTKEWKAPNEVSWLGARKDIQKPQLFFQEALSLLLMSSNELAPLDPIPTPLGNYILLHGLLQRIHIVRDLCMPVMNNTTALPSEETEKLG